MSNRTHRILLPFAVSLSIAGFFGCAQSTSFAQDSSHAQQAGGNSRSLVNPELCEDDNEAGRIRADGQNAVSRRGKVLTITTSKKPVKFVDNKENFESSTSYAFCKFIPELPGYLVKGYAVESQWYILVSDSGSKIDMPGPPVFSPNRRYVAASNWNTVGLSDNKIELWEIVRASRATSFKKVWGMNLDEGSQSAKWGPGLVYWLNETTFEFPQLLAVDEGTLESQHIGWMRVALRGNQWQPVTATTPVTAQPATVSTAATPPATASNTHSSAPARQRLTPEERVTCRAQAQQGRNREERRQLFRECRQGVLMNVSTAPTRQPVAQKSNNGHGIPWATLVQQKGKVLYDKSEYWSEDDEMNAAAILKPSLQKLLGAKYSDFMNNMETQAPIEIKNDVLIVLGSIPHANGHAGAAFYSKQGGLLAVFRSEQKLEYFGDKQLLENPVVAATVKHLMD
ncbi:MAG: hypothetical protein H6973_15015 [Gammaproteobacteria bacterium]|nr:hypothetical protein [Gammaproteobacteria bacterium]